MKSVLTTPHKRVRQWLPCTIILIQPQAVQNLPGAPSREDYANALGLTHEHVDKPDGPIYTGRAIPLAEGLKMSTLNSMGVSHNECSSLPQSNIAHPNLLRNTLDPTVANTVDWASVSNIVDPYQTRVSLFDTATQPVNTMLMTAEANNPNAAGCNAPVSRELSPRGSSPKVVGLAQALPTRHLSSATMTVGMRTQYPHKVRHDQTFSEHSLMLSGAAECAQPRASRLLPVSVMNFQSELQGGQSVSVKNKKPHGGIAKHPPPTGNRSFQELLSPALTAPVQRSFASGDAGCSGDSGAAYYQQSDLQNAITPSASSSESYEPVTTTMKGKQSKVLPPTRPSKKAKRNPPEIVCCVPWQQWSSKFLEFKNRFVVLCNFRMEAHWLHEAFEGLSEHDTTPLSMLLQCFKKLILSRVARISAADLFAVGFGNMPWWYHWMIYAFSPNDQSCILDADLDNCKPLPNVKPHDVSNEVWALITDARSSNQVKAFHKIIYQLYDTWKSRRRRPPAAKSLALDDAVRLWLIKFTSCTFLMGVEGAWDPNNWFASRLMAVASGRPALRDAAREVFCENPILQKVTTNDDEFYQMMVGVAACLAPSGIEPSQRRIAFQFLEMRYRGPNGESILNHVAGKRSAIPECLERGYLKPGLLQSVISGLPCGRDRLTHFGMSVLFLTANLFLRWADMYPSARQATSLASGELDE
eukprot:Blabericola_migrator_1__1858@NODE_1504_length_4394_cov_16_219321_g987_i0_p1_GENE_NODE_1504_length_4394_cov_16_219321_g987_i0NODE_1504_length_4394_cov_16_219321_g987_i0_p1_ORF_typecomplete_len699_score54_46_NODE_1504_length_4394_cov_16_219321_g987_i021404236